MGIFIFPAWLFSNKSFCALLYDLLNKLTITVPLFSACGPQWPGQNPTSCSPSLDFNAHLLPWPLLHNLPIFHLGWLLWDIGCMFLLGVVTTYQIKQCHIPEDYSHPHFLQGSGHKTLTKSKNPWIINCHSKQCVTVFSVSVNVLLMFLLMLKTLLLM
jgi:hypothetical protein